MALLPPGVRHRPLNELPPAAQPGNQLNRDFSSVAPDGSSIGQAILRSQEAQTRLRDNAANSIPQGVVERKELERTLASQQGTLQHAMKVRDAHDRAEMAQAVADPGRAAAQKVANRFKTYTDTPADYLSLLGELEQAKAAQGKIRGA